MFRDIERLELGKHSARTSRHYVDGTGLEVGGYAAVAGVPSTILTHVTAGARIPDRCVVATGAVVAGELPDAGVPYGGALGRALKEVGEGDYFRRETGYAD